MQTIPQRLMEGAAPVWRFRAFCLWAEESRFPDANRFLDSQSGRGTRRTIATVLQCDTLTSEKLPDEDNDDEKHTKTDLSKVLREEAAHCRRLAQLATGHTIRQDLMEMAARLQAIADEIDEP